jgi:hypothetical protein
MAMCAMSEHKGFLITKEMIAAGVAVYGNPGRYETYQQTVVRIFCAMVDTCKDLSGTSVVDVDIVELRGGEHCRVPIGHDLGRPDDDGLLARPDLNEQITCSGRVAPIPLRDEVGGCGAACDMHVKTSDHDAAPLRIGKGSITVLYIGEW